MTTLIRAFLIAAASLGAAGAHATTITVTPQDMGGPDKWNLIYTSGTGSAAITDTNVRSGNGSVEMALGQKDGKADFGYSWGYVAGRTLANLDALSYDWLRSAGGSAVAHLQPAVRLKYDTDGKFTAGNNDTGYLVWEQVYNGGGLVVDTWTSSDILGGNFWMRQLSPGNTIYNYNTDLAEWMSSARPGSPADALNANSAITGIEFGVGSGWGGSFTGFVDNVTVGFKGQAATTWNFETRSSDVPEPGSFALLGLGMIAALAARKRKRA